MRPDNDTPVPSKIKVQVVVFTRSPVLQLLLLQRPPERGSIWQPVTGNVDDTDLSLTEAGLREMAEETGIVGTLSVRDTGRDFNFIKGGVPISERLIVVEVAGPVPVTVSEEHQASAWLPAEEALAKVEWETNREGLRQAIAGVSGEQSRP